MSKPELEELKKHLGEFLAKGWIKAMAMDSNALWTNISTVILPTITKSHTKTT